MNNDLISREALRKNMEFICMGIMAGTEPYNAPLTEIDNAPTVDVETQLLGAELHGIKIGYEEAQKKLIQKQGDLANEVWELYEKYHSHLATNVLEFGDELKELLGKYQKGGE